MPVGRFQFCSTAPAVPWRAPSWAASWWSFRRAADACGKISILQYCTGGPVETSVMGGVLLVVGPDAPPMETPADAPAADSNIVTPLAVALLVNTAPSSAPSAASSSSPADPNASIPPDLAKQNSTQASLTDVPPSDQVSVLPT